MLDKVLIRNISSLFSINMAGYIIPLLTLPFLVRVLGPKGYGILAFSLAIIQYFLIFVRYGFELSITQKIAKLSGDKISISKVFWNVMIIRLLVSIIGIFILLLFINYLDSFEEISDVLIYSYITVIGTALFPQWLFQGKEELGTISFYRVILQIASIPCLFIFVKNENDINVAALITSLPFLIIAFISFFLISKNKWIVWYCPTFKGMLTEIKDGWHLFISMAAINFYTSSTTVLLGFIAGPVSVAIYVSSSKLIKAAQGLYSPISVSFYPRVNSKMNEGKEKSLEIIRYLLKLQTFVAFLVSIVVFILAPFIVDLIFGPGYQRSVLILRVLCLLPVIISIADVMANHVLLTFGYKKEFSRIYLSSTVVSVLILFPAIYYFDAEGAAISVVIIEGLVTLMMYRMVVKKGIQVFKR